MTDPLALLILIAILAVTGWTMVIGTRFATRSPFLSSDVARVLRALPVLGYAAICAKLVAEIAADPASNNLWPLMICFLLVFWLLYAVVLWLVLGLLTLWLRRS